MEQSDRELLLNLTNQNQSLNRLYQRHVKLDRAVENYGRYAGYSHSAAIRHKELKKEKLRTMDDIMAILMRHRTTGDPGG